MRGKVWGVLSVGFLAALVVGHSQPIIIPTQVVTVPFGATALFSLAVGDVTGHAFVIIEMPAHGILLGIPPDLIFIPRPGFSGTDWISFAVTTPEGLLNLGTVKILVLGPLETVSPPALLSEGGLVFSGPTFLVDGYRFALGLQQRFQYFEQSLRATWTHAGFTSFAAVTRLEFEGTWPSPWRLPITSTLDFDPTIPGLNSWTVDARTTIAGTIWAYNFYFSGPDPQTGSYATFQVQGTIGAFTFDSRTKFVTLTPTFGEQRLTLKGPWICDGCPTNWELDFLQTKAGFEHLSFRLKDITIPCPACGGIKTLLDIKVTFTVDEKKVEPTLRIVSEWVACVKPLVALEPVPSGFGLGGIDLYGIEIKCEVSGGYTLRLATAFNSAKNSQVTGDTRFFEVWQLEGPVVPCCGNPGRFQVSVYFEQASGSLFGFGMGNIVLYFPVSRELLVRVGLKVGKVDAADPAKTWILTTAWQGLF